MGWRMEVRQKKAYTYNWVPHPYYTRTMDKRIASLNFSITVAEAVKREKDFSEYSSEE